MDLLFVITHIKFLAEGAFFPVLVCMFTTLVMYYSKTANKFGMEHVLLFLICYYLIAADIWSVNFNSTSLRIVLVDWATRIKDNYREQNKKTKATSNKELFLMINIMTRTMNKMQSTMMDMITALANSQETIQSLQDQVLSVKISVDTACLRSRS